MLIGLISILSALSAAGVCLSSGAFYSLGWLWVFPVSFVGSFLWWAILYFLFFWLMCAIVKMDVPQEEDSPFYRFLAKLTIGALIPIVRVHIHTKGMENIPKDGRFLLVSNHIHDTDPIVLMHLFRDSQLAFISKKENDQKFLVGKILHKLLGQSINRENDREALKTILNCIRLLKEDKASVAVFPEGYTSLDGLLRPFRSGVFKIAQKAEVPIVVCTVRNTRYIFRNAMKLKRTDVYVNLLTVIPAEELKGVTAMDVGNRIYEMMAQDLGPDMVFREETTEETT